ncbi:MAG TPA: Holliday junction resolvase RuvX [Bacteroidales bacterium]|nr:Holliday junction resolvase RuvX [Bacteroidales bacterium]
MSRILAIDYGLKRTGIAVTDPLQLIANGLTTVSTSELWTFLTEYMSREDVESVVIGYPVKMNNTPSAPVSAIDSFITHFEKKYAGIKIFRMDERFTSKMAQQAIIDGGVRKMARRNKALVDTVSATIILQSFMESRNFKI